MVQQRLRDAIEETEPSTDEDERAPEGDPDDDDITVPRIVVTVISCVLVAYAFARFEFWGKKLLFSIMVGTMMLPLIVLRLPQYLMFKELGWLDSYLPLIVPSAFATPRRSAARAPAAPRARP